MAIKISNKIDSYFDFEFDFLNKKIKEIKYKGINWKELFVKYSINEIIERKEFIKNCQTETKLKIIHENFCKVSISALISKTTFIQKINYIISDIGRYSYYQFKSIKLNSQNYDILFFITNPKFINFLMPLNTYLKSKGQKTAFLFWDEEYIPLNFDENYIIPNPSFPNFFHKDYFKYKRLFSSIDRVYGYLPKIKNRKVIIAEGCLLSHHIMGKLGKVYNFNTYCIQWGFFGRSSTKVGWRDMPYNHFFVWGDFFKEKFQLYNRNLDIITVGHPSLKPPKTIEKKNRILFAVQNVMGDHITEVEILNFVDFAISFATKNQQFEVIIRSHPDFIICPKKKQNSTFLKNLFWHEFSTHSLDESLIFSKYCVSISSTLTLESVAYNCYPIYLKINSMHLQIHEIFNSDNEFFKHILLPDELSQFLLSIDHMDFKKYLKDLKSNLFLRFGNETIEYLGKQILNS